MTLAFPKPKDQKKKPHWQWIRAGGREVLNCSRSPGIEEYRKRIKAMWERQNGICCLYGHIASCPGALSLESATFEHENGRGGGKRDDRIEIDGRWINGAAHPECNSLKGSRRINYNSPDRKEAM